MGATESWAYTEDGKLYLHTENDGIVYLRKGAQAVDREISIGELSSNYPTVFKRFVEEEEKAYRTTVLVKHGLPPDFDERVRRAGKAFYDECRICRRPVANRLTPESQAELKGLVEYCKCGPYKRRKMAIGAYNRCVRCSGPLGPLPYDPDDPVTKEQETHCSDCLQQIYSLGKYGS